MWFVHASDPDLFLPNSTDAAANAAVARQQQLNEKTVTDLFQSIRSIGESAQPPAFLALTGDLGLDPCLIAPATAKEPKACADTAVAAQRDQQIERLARIFAASPVHDIYFVAGERDLARGDPGADATGYLNKLLAAVQQKLAAGPSGVVLHNLTGCYDPASSTVLCDADIPDTEYRLIGGPSWSFATAGADAAIQRRQLDTFCGLLARARQQKKKPLVLSHIPAIDDPQLIAQSLGPAERPATPTKEAKKQNDPQTPPPSTSLWKTTGAIFDSWKAAEASDEVAAVFAGHLHDSHRETYQRPYKWVSAESRGPGLSKLYLAPPLSLTGQESSPFQSRGFSVVRLDPGGVESVLYWYDPKTGSFRPEATTRPPRAAPNVVWTSILWLWSLDEAGKPLERMATLLIAFLAAFLTVMAISQISPEPDGQPAGQTSG
ncbi:MAG TPA: hypothetical protein VMJ64_13420, partial [Anaerolineales bacterium]|nr:hypothetical protein [Anaerolineales bacterium]